jgi:inorganic pyrophosphatase
MAKNIAVTIETPKGSAIKYDYDKKSGKFQIGKFLPMGMTFPFDFGFIPKTKGEDGDPLDVIVISEHGSFPGCVTKARIIGCMKAEQSSQPGKKRMIRNDRYLAIPEMSLVFKEIEDVDQLSDEIYKELKDFFCNYNNIEKKKFKEIEKLGRKKALTQIARNQGRRFLLF